MSLATLEQTAPLSSAEFATIDLDRVAEVGRRHQLVGDFLQKEGYGALLVQQPANVAWLTAGADLRRGVDAGAHAALFVTRDARVIVCNNVDTPLLFEHAVAGLGFQLKERPWTEPRNVMLSDLCRGRRVASDSALPNVVDVSLHLPGMRVPLSAYDVAQLREAGRLAAHAVEATARALTPGRTEADVAGELSHRLIKHSVLPQRVQVLGDGRGRRFRHWTHSETPIHRYCTIAAVGCYHGLHVGVARTVSLGEPPRELLEAYEQAALVTATGLFFSQSGWELFEVWNRVKRIYEKCGAGDEWRLADQADVVEFEYGSIPLMPTSEFKLFPGVPVHWHPSVGPVLMGETMLVSDRGAELLTPSTDWPTVPISVKGAQVEVPGILIISPAVPR